MATPIVELADVYDHCAIATPNAALDAKFTRYIAAVTDVIDNAVGDILPTTYDEYHDGGGHFVVVDHTPVISVQLVTEFYGMSVYTLTEQPLDGSVAMNYFGYSVDYKTGQIARRNRGAEAALFAIGDKNVHVQYTAGIGSTVPASLQLAALEDIRVLYQTTELGNRFGSDDEPVDMRSPLRLYPRVMQLLAGFERVPGVS